MGPTTIVANPLYCAGDITGIEKPTPAKAADEEEVVKLQEMYDSRRLFTITEEDEEVLELDGDAESGTLRCTRWRVGTDGSEVVGLS